MENELRTRLTEEFGIRYPIVCAPMALVAGGRLAAAVSSSGGLGIIGGAYAGTHGGEPDLGKELALARGQKFGVGFITWALAKAPQVLDEALRYSPYCVFLSFGAAKPFVDRIRRSGARLICQVQSLRHAQEALDAGANVIVAQGRKREATAQLAQRSRSSPKLRTTWQNTRRGRCYSRQEGSPMAAGLPLH